MLLTLACWPSSAPAQLYHGRSYSETDGLPSTAISDIGQDERGRLLVITRAGIARYDGVEWETLACGMLVSDEYRAGLVRDHEGTIWTARGGRALYLYSLGEDDCWRATVAAPETSRGSVLPIAVAVGGGAGDHIAVATADGVIHVWDGASWSSVSPVTGFPAGLVHDLLSLPDGGLLAATDDGIWRIDLDTLSVVPAVVGPLPSRRVLALTNEPDDSTVLWVVGQDWIARVSGPDVDVVNRDFKLPEPGPHGSVAVVADGLGMVVVASGPRSWAVDTRTHEVRTFGTLNGLAAEGARSVFLDRERNIWLGGERGLSKLGDRRFVGYTSRQGLFEDEVTAISPGPAGEMILAHPHGLSVIVDDRVERVVPLVDDQLGMRIMDLARSPDGTLWVAALEGGLARLNGDEQPHWFSPDSGVTGRATAVAIDNEGQVFLGTDTGLFVVEGDALIPVPTGNVHDGVRRIVRGTDGILYVATTGKGLLIRRGAQWTVATSTEIADANQIYTVTGRDPLWVGTRAGLFIVESGHLVRPKQETLHLDRPVFLLAEDRSNGLWIGTDHGLFHWDGTARTHFTMRSGLSGNELNRAAAFEDVRGRVWFGTEHGVSCYRPEVARFSPPPPLVELRFVDAGDRRLPLDEDITLAAGTDTLTFHVRAISLIEEEAVEYRTRLSGFERDWLGPMTHPATGVRYTSLPAGTYVLQVQARNPTGDWSEVVTSAPIVLQAPVWRRPWFLAMIALGVVMVSTRTLSVAHRRRQVALTDPVTGVANREALRQRLEQILGRDGSHRFVLVAMRLDRFEAVVASLGHAGGDDLLIQTVSRLGDLEPEATVAALGGGMLGVLVTDVPPSSDPSPRVRTLQKMLSLPYRIADIEVFSPVTCGVLVDPGGRPAGEHVLRDAIATLQQAQEEASGSHRISRPNIRREAIETLQLEADLSRAIERGQLFLLFQPIVTASSHEVVAVEALLRWQHPKLGILEPDSFLGLAQSSGLILPIGEWVLTEACHAAVRIATNRNGADPVTMHVNVHAHQLSQTDVCESVSRVLESSGVSPHIISLELTEHALMRDPVAAAHALGQLRQLGVGLCIDDFGTGHSSLAVLRTMPVETLKVDRSFVEGLAEDQGAEIIRAISELARSLGLRVTVEGVTTVEQLAILDRLECDAYQGFLFARPLSEGDVSRMILAQSADHA
jgi:predicted signal transduction protein with EAL and GGDEF domain/ligand-binding sensor domain-containing protein